KFSKSIYWTRGCGKGACPTPFARGPRPGCALPSSHIPPVLARTRGSTTAVRCARLARTPSYLCAHTGEHRRRAHAPPFAYGPRLGYAPPCSHTLPPLRACGDTAVAVQPSTTCKVGCARCGVWEPGCRGGTLVCAKGGRASRAEGVGGRAVPLCTRLHERGTPRKRATQRGHHARGATYNKG
ncbi:hypothetical protein BJY52DRAFT_1301635, partial [Lactarius psammicola]